MASHTKKKQHPRTLFVTVGTTLFDALVQAVTSEKVLQMLADLGFTKMIVQYGKGQEPNNNTVNMPDMPIQVEVYNFKATLADDLQCADVVIGHAGAGTISETLAGGSGGRPKLVVVINRELMHNHQTELAYAMRQCNYLYVVKDPADLMHVDTWNAIDTFEPTPFPGGNVDDFPRLLTAFF